MFPAHTSPTAPGFGKVVNERAMVDAIATKHTGGVAGSLPDVPLAHVSIVALAQTQ